MFFFHHRINIMSNYPKADKRIEQKKEMLAELDNRYSEVNLSLKTDFKRKWTWKKWKWKINQWVLSVQGQYTNNNRTFKLWLLIFFLLYLIWCF